MLNRIKAMWARLWHPRRRTGERGFNDQRAASQYRDRPDIDLARGQSYEPPPGP
jgi:hypothetical protein